MAKINTFFLLPLSFCCKLTLNQRILSNVLGCPYLRELWCQLSIMRSRVSGSWELIGVGWPKFWSFMSWPFLKWTHISSLQRKGGDWGNGVQQPAAELLAVLLAYNSTLPSACTGLPRLGWVFYSFYIR